MTNPDQRCGTCKWWAGDRKAEWDCDSCNFQMPESVIDRDQMSNYEGESCPCWAPIENGEAE